MLLGILGCLFTSCFSDLDTMPLDDNELVSEKVYQTADGYTGVLAKCYSSLICQDGDQRRYLSFGP